MVALYADGKKIGTLADAERLLPALLADGTPVEFRDETGNKYWAVQPTRTEPPCPWDPSITWEEIERRHKGEMLTFEELKKRMGWE